jgi:acyl-ACP thioesterase
VPAQPLQETFQVHTYEADAWGLLDVPALSGWLQEAAGRHAEALGAGMESLMRRGLTWVLSRQRVEIDLPIPLGSEVTVATWPTGVDRLSALRDFEVRLPGGEVAARAVTQWLVLDLASRRPVRPDRVLGAHLLPELPHVLALPAARLPDVGAPALERRFSIRYRDIDRNLHVTNASYVAWAVEAVPQDAWRTLRVRTMEAHFLAECHLGSTVRSRSSGAGEGAWAHAIVREEDGRELARLRTSWVARGEAAPADGPPPG